MRILLVSDIHSNLVALDAVIQDAGTFDRIWCLGDVVGYGPEPNECIERLKGFNLVSLAGNHDLAVLDRVDVAEFSPGAREAIYWTRERLNDASIIWLEGLSSAAVLPEEGILLAHASPRDPVWEYVNSPAIAAACFDAFDLPVCFNGHTHVPVIYRKPTYGIGVAAEKPPVNMPVPLALDRMLVNPGSVGQPRDDDVRASYALIDLAAMTFTHRRVGYDISATQRAMRAANLPSRLIRRLRLGE